MEANKVHSKILKFAIEEITFTQFYAFLMESTLSNPIYVKSDKVSGGVFDRNVYWGPFSNGIARGAIYDYEAKDYMVVQSIQDGAPGKDAWRTIDLQNVTECRFEGKKYRVR
jgi:hypothetical protein